MSVRVTRNHSKLISSGNLYRDWEGVIVELEQSLKALSLVQDLLKGITSSLQVSVQSVQEHLQHQQELI